MADSHSVPDSDLVGTALIYPDRRGETYSVKANPEHRWYYKYGQTPNEVTLIKCFDNLDDGRAKRVPHTAFTNPEEVRLFAYIPLIRKNGGYGRCPDILADNAPHRRTDILASPEFCRFTVYELARKCILGWTIKSYATKDGAMSMITRDFVSLSPRDPNPASAELHSFLLETNCRTRSFRSSPSCRRSITLFPARVLQYHH